MPRFRIFHLVAEKGEAFRARTPRKPPYILHRSHYEEGPEVSADSPYALWQELLQNREAGSRTSRRTLDVGDVLQFDDQLLLCNYWGFDSAEWRDGARRGRANVRADSPPDS